MIIKKLKNDKRYKRYLTVLDNVRSSINLESDRLEATNLHSTRTVRSLTGKKRFSPKAIMTAIATDLSVRARLVELRQNNSIKLSLVESATEAIHSHIRTNHQSIMRGLSNEASRKAMLEELTQDAIGLQRDIRAVVDLLDYFIKDIDQAGYAVRNMVEILKLLDSSKKII